MKEPPYKIWRIKGMWEVVAKKANDKREATHQSPTPCGVKHLWKALVGWSECFVVPYLTAERISCSSFPVGAHSNAVLPDTGKDALPPELKDIELVKD